MKLSKDQKNILLGLLIGIVGSIVGTLLISIFGKNTWSRALDFIVYIVVGAVAAGLILLIGARVPKNKDEEK